MEKVASANRHAAAAIVLNRLAIIVNSRIVFPHPSFRTVRNAYNRPKTLVLYTPRTPSPRDGRRCGFGADPSAPTVPRKRTDSRRRPHAPHGFPPRRQRARTLQRPARARRRETFSVAGSELAIRPRTRPARINASVTLYRTDAKAPHASGAYLGRPFYGRQHTGGRPGKQRTLPFPARRARPGGGRPCGRKSRFPRRRDGKTDAGREEQVSFAFLRLRGYTAAQLGAQPRAGAPHFILRYIYALESMVHPHSERSPRRR